jgi:hypothetical protein
MDRTATRPPPAGRPLVKQTSGRLLFLHWPIRFLLLREPDGAQR